MSLYRVATTANGVTYWGEIKADPSDAERVRRWVLVMRTHIARAWPSQDVKWTRDGAAWEPQ